MLSFRGRVSCAAFTKLFSRSKSHTPTHVTGHLPRQTSYLQSLLKVKMKPCVGQPVHSSFSYIHTSRPRNLHPMIILLVVKPATRVAAAVAGWSIKRWWKRLSLKDKAKIRAHFLRHKIRYGGLLLFLLASAYSFYVNHITANPYTGRKRFMIYNSAQLEVLAKEKFDSLIAVNCEGKTPLGNTDKRATVILEVMNRLLAANVDIREIQNRQWTLRVLDDDEDFFVGALPSGQILFCTGFLKLLQNEHQLAHVLAHEISHVILEHHAETVSHGYLISGLMILPMALIWAIVPNEIAAALMGWIFNKLVNMTVIAPYSRVQETEADTFSLKLMAKACYDVRESSVFWGMLSLSNEKYRGKWFDTHPSDSNRQSCLDGQMMEAILLRQYYKCSELPQEDPRFALWSFQRLKNNEKEQVEESERKMLTNALPINEEEKDRRDVRSLVTKSSSKDEEKEIEGGTTSRDSVDERQN